MEEKGEEVREEGRGRKGGKRAERRERKVMKERRW